MAWIDWFEDPIQTTEGLMISLQGNFNTTHFIALMMVCLFGPLFRFLLSPGNSLSSTSKIAEMYVVHLREDRNSQAAVRREEGHQGLIQRIIVLLSAPHY